MTVFFFSTLAVGAGICTSGGKNQASSCIEQAMQRFSSPHGCVWVHGLVDLRERIEQAPCCSFPECRVYRMPPLIKHIGDLRGRDRLAINRTDHEVVLPVKLIFWHVLKTGIFNPQATLEDLKPILRIALGKFEGEWELTLYPESDPEGRKVPVRWARCMILGHALILAASIATGQWILPIMLTFGYQCYGS